jgi:hypothetical protein
MVWPALVPQCFCASRILALSASEMIPQEILLSLIESSVIIYFLHFGPIFSEKQKRTKIEDFQKIWVQNVENK